MRVTINVDSRVLGDVIVSEENMIESYQYSNNQTDLSALLAKAVDKINRAYRLSEKPSLEVPKVDD